ncbi:MAG: capsular biosynthesis protein, partial [Gammaproteobacteria bacterium]
IVAGEAWVRGKGLTIDVDSPESYVEELNKLPLKQRLSSDVQERALKYAYHFFFRRMIPLNIVKRSKGHEVFNYSFNNVQDLEPGLDKGLDVICEGILSGNPYIYEPH